MSWTVNYIVDNGETTDFIETGCTTSIEHQYQFVNATFAAEYMIASGALGHPTARYRVSLTGHGNPGNSPVEGWSDDFISIQVAQIL